jgi:acetylornithine deacetylase/succinyl-diaminopimelate desuccinylase-like protein
MQLEDGYLLIERFIDDHFDDEVAFLQELVRMPTDTPPGDNAPHAELTRTLLLGMGIDVSAHPVPPAVVAGAGLVSITNLLVRESFAKAGPVIALNAHGDAVPAGPGWTYPPHEAKIVGGKLYGRAAAVSKSDFATYVFALRALKSCGLALCGTLEIHLTYDEEFGGELGPGFLLEQGLTDPDIVIAAGFSYQVVTAHNGCLQLEVTVTGRMAHAAIPASGIDALKGATALLNCLYDENPRLALIHSKVTGIDHPYLNVGWIKGGTNTNVVPGEVVLKLDRRMIPEENPETVERDLRALIIAAVPAETGLKVAIRRLMLARPLLPSAKSQAVAAILAAHAKAVFDTDVPIRGTPLYTDARLYAERGAAALLFGAGPRTILESNAKRANEHVDLSDLRRATKVVARTLAELLTA